MGKLFGGVLERSQFAEHVEEITFNKPVLITAIYVVKPDSAQSQDLRRPLPPLHTLNIYARPISADRNLPLPLLATYSGSSTACELTGLPGSVDYIVLRGKFTRIHICIHGQIASGVTSSGRPPITELSDPVQHESTHSLARDPRLARMSVDPSESVSVGAASASLRDEDEWSVSREGSAVDGEVASDSEGVDVPDSDLPLPPKLTLANSRGCSGIVGLEGALFLGADPSELTIQTPDEAIQLGARIRVLCGRLELLRQSVPGGELDHWTPSPLQTATIEHNLRLCITAANGIITALSQPRDILLVSFQAPSQLTRLSSLLATLLPLLTGPATAVFSKKIFGCPTLLRTLLLVACRALQSPLFVSHFAPQGVSALVSLLPDSSVVSVTAPLFPSVVREGEFSPSGHLVLLALVLATAQSQGASSLAPRDCHKHILHLLTIPLPIHSRDMVLTIAHQLEAYRTVATAAELGRVILQKDQGSKIKSTPADTDVAATATQRTTPANAEAQNKQGGIVSSLRTMCTLLERVLIRSNGTAHLHCTPDTDLELPRLSPASSPTGVWSGALPDSVVGYLASTDMLTVLAAVLALPFPVDTNTRTHFVSVTVSLLTSLCRSFRGLALLAKSTQAVDALLCQLSPNTRGGLDGPITSPTIFSFTVFPLDTSLRGFSQAALDDAAHWVRVCCACVQAADLALDADDPLEAVNALQRISSTEIGARAVALVISRTPDLLGLLVFLVSDADEEALQEDAAISLLHVACMLLRTVLSTPSHGLLPSLLTTPDSETGTGATDTLLERLVAALNFVSTECTVRLPRELYPELAALLAQLTPLTSGTSPTATTLPDLHTLMDIVIASASTATEWEGDLVPESKGEFIPMGEGDAASDLLRLQGCLSAICHLVESSDEQAAVFHEHASPFATLAFAIEAMTSFLTPPGLRERKGVVEACRRLPSYYNSRGSAGANVSGSKATTTPHMKTELLSLPGPTPELMVDVLTGLLAAFQCVSRLLYASIGATNLDVARVYSRKRPHADSSAHHSDAEDSDSEREMGVHVAPHSRRLLSAFFDAAIALAPLLNCEQEITYHVATALPNACWEELVLALSTWSCGVWRHMAKEIVGKGLEMMKQGPRASVATARLLGELLGSGKVLTEWLSVHPHLSARGAQPLLGRWDESQTLEQYITHYMSSSSRAHRESVAGLLGPLMCVSPLLGDRIVTSLNGRLERSLSQLESDSQSFLVLVLLMNSTVEKFPDCASRFFELEASSLVGRGFVSCLAAACHTEAGRMQDTLVATALISLKFLVLLSQVECTQTGLGKSQTPAPQLCELVRCLVRMSTCDLQRLGENIAADVAGTVLETLLAICVWQPQEGWITRVLSTEEPLYLQLSALSPSLPTHKLRARVCTFVVFATALEGAEAVETLFTPEDWELVDQVLLASGHGGVTTLPAARTSVPYTEGIAAFEESLTLSMMSSNATLNEQNVSLSQGSSFSAWATKFLAIRHRAVSSMRINLASTSLAQVYADLCDQDVSQPPQSPVSLRRQVVRETIEETVSDAAPASSFVITSSRRDDFRQRRGNSSRAPSMHVDEFESKPISQRPTTQPWGRV